MKIKPGSIIEVTWRDSNVPNGIWLNEDEIDDYHSHDPLIRSVGYFYKKR